VQKLTEAQIEQQCCQWLWRSGYFVFLPKDQASFRDGSYRKPKSFQIAGVSDCIAIKDGQVYFIEYKSKTGVQSAHQKTFQKNIEMNGGVYLLVKSVDELKERINNKLS
jgi:hypothetical protein